MTLLANHMVTTWTDAYAAYCWTGLITALILILGIAVTKWLNRGRKASIHAKCPICHPQPCKNNTFDKKSTFTTDDDGKKLDRKFPPIF